MMNVEQSFNESVFEVCDTPQPSEQKELPTITDDKVEYFLRKIREWQDRIDEVNRYAKDEIGKIQIWQATETNTLNNSIQWYEQALQVYATEKLKDSDKRSLSFPSGKFGFTKQQPEFRVNDENLLAFAKTNCPEFIKVTEKVEWGALKKTLTLAPDNKLVNDDGVVVEGVTYLERPDKFSVKVV